MNENELTKGVCRICGCTDDDPCFNPRVGNCWWIDETHTLCSHCADEELSCDPETRHCINSTFESDELIKMKIYGNENNIQKKFPDVKVQKLQTSVVFSRQQVEETVLKMCDSLGVGLLYYNYSNRWITVYTSEK